MRAYAVAAIAMLAIAAPLCAAQVPDITGCDSALLNDTTITSGISTCLSGITSNVTTCPTTCANSLDQVRSLVIPRPSLNFAPSSEHAVSFSIPLQLVHAAGRDLLLQHH